MQRSTAYPWVRGGGALVLHSPHKKNTIKIKENLVSISDFLFMLRIRQAFLQKHDLKEKAPPAEIKTHMKRQEALSCFPSESMKNYFTKRQVSTALSHLYNFPRAQTAAVVSIFLLIKPL